jgi:hypothetical protein
MSVIYAFESFREFLRNILSFFKNDLLQTQDLLNSRFLD